MGGPGDDGFGCGCLILVLGAAIGGLMMPVVAFLFGTTVAEAGPFITLPCTIGGIIIAAVLVMWFSTREKKQ